jgi:hypothetical protein
LALTEYQGWSTFVRSTIFHTWLVRNLRVCCLRRYFQPMLATVISEIDREIARLQRVRALLSSEAGIPVKRGPGRPPKATSASGVKTSKRRRRAVSAEGREQIRQAQIRRWAATKKAAKASKKAV